MRIPDAKAVFSNINSYSLFLLFISAISMAFMLIVPNVVNISPIWLHENTPKFIFLTLPVLFIFSLFFLPLLGLYSLFGNAYVASWLRWSLIPIPFISFYIISGKLLSAEQWFSETTYIIHVVIFGLLYTISLHHLIFRNLTREQVIVSEQISKKIYFSIVFWILIVIASRCTGIDWLMIGPV